MAQTLHPGEARLKLDLPLTREEETLMSKRKFHVVPFDDGWALKEEGKTNPLSKHNTQKEAIDEGRNMAVSEDDEVDLVVHRADGRIRERLAFTEEHTSNRAENGRKKEALKPEDVMSVGTRIRWQPILAGAIIALSTMYTLTVLASAIGFSLYNQVSDDAMFYGAAVVAAFTLLVSLYLGGLVVSQTTAGEKPMEALTYGVVLWGIVMLVIPALVAAGVNTGWGFLQDQAIRGTVENPSVQFPNMTNAEIARLQERAGPALWLTFGTIILSLAAAVGGAFVGTGPRLVFGKDFFLRAKQTSAAK
jgi:hypothetical protein